MGAFITPTDDPRSTSAVEVKWGVHVAGDRRSQWAEPSDSATLSILVSGCFWLQFPDREVRLATQVRSFIIGHYYRAMGFYINRFPQKYRGNFLLSVDNKYLGIIKN